MKIKGIKNICSLTKKYCEEDGSGYVCIVYYDRHKGAAWGVIEDDPRNIDHDPGVFYVGNIYTPSTMADIHAKIERQLAIERHRRMKR